jgi:hypothetical protein
LTTAGAVQAVPFVEDVMYTSPSSLPAASVLLAHTTNTRPPGSASMEGNDRERKPCDEKSTLSSVPTCTGALERVRQAARKDRTPRFTARLHHVYDVDRLRAAYYALKRGSAFPPATVGVLSPPTRDVQRIVPRRHAHRIHGPPRFVSITRAPPTLS